MSTDRDIEGKTIVITGATAGIGRATAEDLARRGAMVVGISRSRERCDQAAAEIRAATGNNAVSFLVADLGSLEQVRVIAEDLLSQLPRIDVLINNVGAIFFRRRESVDGFEMTFALNHLSWFLLTRLLEKRLVASAPARIVNVSSSAQFGGKIHFDDLQLTKRFKPFTAYGQSKLANMLFTYELDRRLAGKGVTVNAMHPGLVRTRIGTSDNAILRVAQKLILWNQRSPEEGAKTVIYLAASSDVAGVSGKFFIDEAEVPSADASYNEADAARLWQISKELVRPFTGPQVR